MKRRSVLMMALREHIERQGLSQSQAAKLFGVTRPLVSGLMRGKINLFGLDSLVNMAATAGMHIEMHVLEAARHQGQGSPPWATGRSVFLTQAASPVDSERGVCHCADSDTALTPIPHRFSEGEEEAVKRIYAVMKRAKEDLAAPMGDSRP